MKAVVQDRYGPPEVLRIAEVARPVPSDDEVLIRIRATTVSQTDTHIRAANPFVWRLFLGFRRPRRPLGVEFAGEVEGVGAAVRRFRVGDHVFGGSPGLQGAYAEFMCLRETGLLAHMPAGMAFDEAAAMWDGGRQALGHLLRAKVGEGMRILIYGASGSCGTASVQLAKYFNAHVTAVCGTRHVDLVRSLGADEVVDYLKECFTRNGETYDVILDAVGKGSFKQSKSSLRPGGLYVATDGVKNLFLWLWTRWIGTKKVVFAAPRHTQKDVLFLKELIEAGHYRAVIDRRYPWEQVVEAHRYVEAWHKAGNVVLIVS